MTTPTDEDKIARKLIEQIILAFDNNPSPLCDKVVIGVAKKFLKDTLEQGRQQERTRHAALLADCEEALSDCEAWARHSAMLEDAPELYERICALLSRLTTPTNPHPTPEAGGERSKLDRLMDVVIGDPEDVATMSREEINAYLKEEGIDPEAGKEELRRRMAAIREAITTPTNPPPGQEEQTA